MKPTIEEIEFVLEAAQYGYESHADWEKYFRTHECAGEGCSVCQQATLLGDAEFHATQKKRCEVELRILQWVKSL